MNKFYPTSIDIIRKKFIFKNEYAIISNIAYSIQFLEFIEKELKNNNTNVIHKMLIKDYIVNAMAIIESALYLVCQKEQIIKHSKIKLIQLINIVEKNNLLEISADDLNKLKELKKMRNKIHIYSSKESNQTDFNSFKDIDYEFMKYILYKILNSKKITLIPFTVNN